MPALGHAALKTGSECSFTPVKSAATPTVPRLFLPCLTFARRLFVQNLVFIRQGIAELAVAGSLGKS